MFFSYIDFPTLFSIDILETDWISNVKLILDIDKEHIEIPCKFKERYSKNIDEGVLFYSVFTVEYTFFQAKKGVFSFSFLKGSTLTVTHKEYFEIREF